MCCSVSRRSQPGLSTGRFDWIVDGGSFAPWVLPVCFARMQLHESVEIVDGLTDRQRLENRCHGGKPDGWRFFLSLGWKTSTTPISQTAKRNLHLAGW